MSEAGVIPPPEERKRADIWVRHVGQLADMESKPLAVGVDYDTVTIGPSQYTEPIWTLTREMAEEFAHLFVAACWEAGENKRRMDAETPT